MKTKRALIAIVVALAVPTIVRAAQDDQRFNMDNNFPLITEDSFVAKRGEFDLKLDARYARNRDRTDSTTLLPEAIFGLGGGFDFHLAANALIGDADHTNSGDSYTSIKWLFHEEKPGELLPSLAVEGQLTLPTGTRSDGLDTTVTFFATKTLTWAPTFDSISLNVSWLHNSAPLDGERDDAYLASLAYGRRVAHHTAVVGDIVWQSSTAKHTAGQSVEIGLIETINDHLGLAGSLGTTLGDDSPSFTATVGFYWTL